LGEGSTPSGLNRRWAAAFTSPAGILVGIFLVFPALWTLYLGLTNYQLLGLSSSGSHFVGISNYRDAISSPAFAHSLEVTLIFVAASAVVGQTVLGFALAWVMRSWAGIFRRVLESLVIVAWIIPSSVVAFLWISFLQGNIGPLVERGTLDAILHTGIDWLIQYPLLSIIVFNIWRGAAFSMLLFGAAIQSVPPSYIETTKVAGASQWQQLRDVVFPSIRGYILTDLLLISLWTFNDFNPYLLTGGGPADKTNILPIFVYKTAFEQGFMGLGSAISTIILLINLIIALVYLRLLKRRSWAR